MPKHTPGRWEVYLNQSITANGTLVAHASLILLTVEEQAANARLIAAAPELLKALKGLASTANPNCWCDDYGPMDKHSQACLAAQAAVMAAEGKEVANA